MGVGVYRNTFNGTGGSINVSGPEASGDGYKAYVVEVGLDDALSESDWIESVFERFREGLAHTLRDIGRELGMSLSEDGDSVFTSEPASFDRELCAVAHNDVLGMGWRSWQDDFVVGIGSDLVWAGEDADAHQETILRQYLLPTKMVTGAYEQMTKSVEDYVRLRLQDEGFECRYPTGPYSTAAYAKPEDMAAAIASAKADFEDANKVLATPVCELDQSARRALLADLIEVQRESGRDWSVQEFKPVSVLYHQDEGMLLVVQPMDNSAEVLRELPVDKAGTSLRSHLDQLAAAFDHDLLPVRFDDPQISEWIKRKSDECSLNGEVLVDVEDVNVVTGGAYEVDLDWESQTTKP